MATENTVDIKIAASVEGAPEIDKLGESLAATGEAAPAIDKLGSSLATTAEAAGTLGDKGAESAQGLGKTTDTSGELSEAVNGMSEQIDNASTALLSLVGIQFGADGVKQIIEIADAYKNLESRIKLVTGEGANFEAAFDGISAVALRTNSNLVSTGDLFAKIAEAGKQMGIGQDEALNLTETINQAVQLSGASAEASSAAITQLIQGLQSGVLRGDEFNSIMEQAPRLSTAFAEGLGVSTGELRKMAEQGVLTSATIIKALKGQSETVAAEFDKLPPTVGRAMTNLSTQFMLYVGATDKAGGYTNLLATYSGKLAGVIDGLASNLAAVATVMIHVGEAMGAMKLLTMAQSWLAINAATAASSAALASNTVSTEVNTVAKVANNAATLAGATAATAAAAATAKSAATHDAMGMAIAKQTPALTGNAKALTEMGAGLGGAAVGAASVRVGFGQAAPAVGLFSKAAGVASTAVGLLGRVFAPLLALDIVFNFRKYGTAIGEFAARLRGAKDRTEELEAADKAWAQAAKERAEALARQTAAIKEAADASFSLSTAASATITEFDKLTAAGDSSAEAIQKIGKDFDLSSIPGIKNAVSVLDKLAADGKISATEFEQAWSDALKGQDLATFEVKFRAAMQQAKADADAAAAAWQDAIARGLNGAELKKFEDAARQTLNATGRDSERLAQVMDASLRESIKRSGLDFDLISGGMSKASVSAINDTEAMIKGLDRLKDMGVDTAQALAASIGKGIDTADSQKAIESVRVQIEAVRKVLGDKVADGLLDQAKQKATELGDALDKAKPGINSLREAMKELGVTSDQTFKDTAAKSAAAYQAMKASGTASIRELADGFKKYAIDAIAANGGVASEALKAEAAFYRIGITVDATGKSIVGAMGSAGDAVKQLGADAEKTAADLKKLKDPFAAFSKNSTDGGTGTSLMMQDKIWALREKTQKGKTFDITQAEFDEAKKQAEQAWQWIQDMGPTASPQAVFDARAMMQALQSTYINITDKKDPNQPLDDMGQLMKQGLTEGQAKAEIEKRKKAQSASTAATPPASATQNHTYTVNIPNYGTVNVASANDANSLTSIIDQLARAKAAAGV